MKANTAANIPTYSMIAKIIDSNQNIPENSGFIELPISKRESIIMLVAIVTGQKALL